MRDLSTFRSNWDEADEWEHRVPRTEDVATKLQQWLELQRFYEPRMLETEPVFRADRMRALEELQNRLLKLKAWEQRQRGQIDQIAAPYSADPSRGGD
jgi:integrase